MSYTHTTTAKPYPSYAYQRTNSYAPSISQRPVDNSTSNLCGFVVGCLTMFYASGMVAASEACINKNASYFNQKQCSNQYGGACFLAFMVGMACKQVLSKPSNTK